MQVFLTLAAVVVAAHAGLIASPLAPTLFRSPSLETTVVHTNKLGGSFVYSTAGVPAYSPLVYTAPLAHPYAYPLGFPHSVFGHPVLAPGQTFLPVIPGIIPLGDAKNSTEPAAPASPAEGEETTPKPSDESAGEASNDGGDESKPEEPQADDTVSVESA